MSDDKSIKSEVSIGPPLEFKAYGAFDHLNDETEDHFSQAETVELSTDDLKSNPNKAFALSQEGKRVIIKDENGMERMRFSPHISDPEFDPHEGCCDRLLVEEWFNQVEYAIDNLRKALIKVKAEHGHSLSKELGDEIDHALKFSTIQKKD